jgi:hypothetical protein
MGSATWSEGIPMPPAGFEPATFGLEVPPQRAGYVELQAIGEGTAG